MILKLLMLLINCWISVGVIINRICGNVIFLKICYLLVLLILVVLIWFLGRFWIIFVEINIVVGILIYILIIIMVNFV